MRDLHVGALPLCGEDDRLHGIITVRDIVVRCIAEGWDPRETTAQQMAQGTPIWVDVDADESEVLRLMEDHAIRRLPVIENHRLVGMISEADLATHPGRAWDGTSTRDTAFPSAASPRWDADADPAAARQRAMHRGSGQVGGLGSGKSLP